MAIDTLANVKQSLGISGNDDDSLLTLLQGAAESFVQEYCGRTFAAATYVEHHSGTAEILFLRNYPVATIVSLHVDPAEGFGPTTILPATAYVVHAGRGVVESRTGPFVPARPSFRLRPDAFPRAVRVEYTTPDLPAPAAVQRAYAELIGFWYRQTKTHADLNHQDVLSRPVDSGFETFHEGLSAGFRLPASILQILNLYRVPAA